MERVQVDSSNIASIGYDQDNSTLEIEFIKGGVYQYYDVPSYVYEEIMSASSHGVYFSKNIKGTYNYSQV